MNEAEIRRQLREWILNRAKNKPASFADDVPVLEKGILTSLDIVELILHIERLRGGEEVSPDTLEPAAFRDVNAMVQAFFRPA